MKVSRSSKRRIYTQDAHINIILSAVDRRAHARFVDAMVARVAQGMRVWSLGSVLEMLKGAA